MKLAEMVNLINKAFLNTLIEKMDRLMDIGGFDIDGDVLQYHHGKNRRGEKENQYVAQPACYILHSVFSCQLSVVSFQLPVVSCQLSVL